MAFKTREWKVKFSLSIIHIQMVMVENDDGDDN